MTGQADLLPKHAKPLMRQLLTILKKSVVVKDGGELTEFKVSRREDGTFHLDYTLEVPTQEKTV